MYKRQVLRTSVVAPPSSFWTAALLTRGRYPLAACGSSGLHLEGIWDSTRVSIDTGKVGFRLVSLWVSIDNGKVSMLVFLQVNISNNKVGKVSV